MFPKRRGTQSLVTGFEKLAKSLRVHTLDLSKSDSDLRRYVEEEMSNMHGDAHFRNQVMDRLLQKAQGNFLWTSLVVSEILDCHTQDAVHEALEAIPDGLEDLYFRMDDTLGKSLRPNDQALGRCILEWTACSRRAMTLDELREALQQDQGQILDLRFTIGKVCGDFVVVDPKGTISMIHLTARDYLMQNSSLHFHVAASVAHQKLMLKCLHTITAFEAKLAKGQPKVQSFILYAATSWPFHLEMSAGSQDQMSLTALARFFSSRCVLTWIYILSLSKEIRVLISASKIIGTFLKITNRMDEDRSPLMHRLKDKDLLASWTIDLIRIVGKFAPQLLVSPRLIFRLIAPFCPPDSIINNQFAAGQGASNIVIDGLENLGWDDCVAKFAVPGGATPISVRCVSRYLALLMRDGTIMLFYADTLEEARKFKHGERVLAWCFNEFGDSLVTCSLSRTIVWHVATGRQMLTIPHIGRVRPLAVAFGAEANTVLICSDDRKVRRAYLETSDEALPSDQTSEGFGMSAHLHDSDASAMSPQSWQTIEGVLGVDHFEGKMLASPRCVEFNSEGTQVAVTYRETPLSVWSLEEPCPSLIGKCRSSGSSQEIRNTSASDIQDISWNNVTGHILGMIKDARCLFKWHPSSGEYAESSQFPVGRVSCSPDGKFFVTSSRDGSLRIWDFYHFSVIYQLSCNTMVTDLAIDPVDARIYDVRETFCSVWKPNALLRMWDEDDKASDSQSTLESSNPSTMISEASYNTSQPVTSLSVNPDDLSYAIGDEQGTISHFSANGDILQSLGQAFMTVRPLCWNGTGSMLAFSDLARHVVVKRITPLEAEAATVNVLDAKESERIHQLLLSWTGDFVLAVSQRFVNIWSTIQKQRTCTWPQTELFVWIQSPVQRSHIIGFGYSSIQLAQWDQFQDSKTIPILRVSDAGKSFDGKTRRPSSFYPMSPTEIQNTVGKVLLTLEGDLALIETFQITTQRHRKHFMIISLDELHTSDLIRALPLPRPLQERLLIPLGFVTPDALHSGARRFSAQSYTERRRSSGALTTLTRTVSPPTAHADQVLAFLDHDYWVCTFQISKDTASRVKRHYFLPRDWLNMEWMQLAVMRPDGTLLCPRNGEVAVVKFGLTEEWLE